MKSKSPHGLPRRFADELTVLLDHLLRTGAREEVEIECTPDKTVFDEGYLRVGRSEQKNVGASSAGESRMGLMI